MEIRELRSLVTLAELGSITHTGSALNLTPAAIHKQLKSLERELQTQLYERHERRLRLTQAAEMILPHVRELLAQYGAAMRALEEWKGVERGQVRIGAGPSISSHILPPLLGGFREKYPEVGLQVETGSSQLLLEKLEKGSLDLAMLVASGQLEGPGMSIEAEWEYEVVLVSNLPGTPKRCALTSLAGSPFILFQKGSRIESLIDRYFSDVGVRPSVAMRFDNAEAIRAMTRSGLGISMLPAWTVREDLETGRLRVIRQREKKLFMKVVLVRLKSRYLPRPAEAFIELVRERRKEEKGRHSRLRTSPG